MWPKTSTISRYLVTDIASPRTRADEHPTRFRCSDADRDQTSSRLRDAAGEGRLTIAELDERLAAVYAAKYRDDLDLVIADLPQPEPATTGWWDILARLRLQLALELAILLGRADVGSKRRRLVLAGLVILVVLYFAGVMAGALHGFGGDGLEHHGFEHAQPVG
jgi:hypothetical protein